MGLILSNLNAAPSPHAARLQPCVFRVDYQLEQAGNKEFGTVFVNEKENVAVSLVAAGLAKVRTPGGSQSAFYDDLAKAAADAEAKGLGVHTKDREAAAAAVRDLLSQDGGCCCPPAWGRGAALEGGWCLEGCCGCLLVRQWFNSFVSPAHRRSPPWRPCACRV